MISVMLWDRSAYKVRIFFHSLFLTALLTRCEEDIRQAILVSNFVDTLLNNARGGTMWGMEVAARILRSEFLKHS